MKKTRRVRRLELGSIDDEAKACRRAFKGFAAGGSVLHRCHDRVVEQLMSPAEDRIAYILSDKPEYERALRLRLFRPLSEAKEKLYNEALAPARKAYEEALAPARKACEEALAPARKAYEEALAPARKAYDEAFATARKAYEEALAPARKACEEALTTAHAKVCVPGCPWDGETIFGKGGRAQTAHAERGDSRR